MNLYDEISRNKRNSYILITLFLIIISLLGYLIGLIYGIPIFGFVIAFMFAFFLTIINFYTGDKTILTLSRAKELTKEQDPYLVNTVEGLAIASGIPTPKIYIIQEDSPNAFATGRDPKHASITLTSGLRKKMNREELEGVIGHEMSHIKNFDIRMMMLVAVLIGIVALLSDFLLRSFFWGGGRKRGRHGGGSIGIILIVLGLVLAILAPIIAQAIRFAISRKREFLADADGVMLTKNPRGLANALKKIRDDNDTVVDTANRATAHLYIENPLRNTKVSFKGLWNTHPDINERIKRLEAL